LTGHHGWVNILGGSFYGRVDSMSAFINGRNKNTNVSERVMKSVQVDHFDLKPYNQKHIFIKNPVHMFVTKSHGAANLLWSVHPLQLPGLL